MQVEEVFCKGLCLYHSQQRKTVSRESPGPGLEQQAPPAPRPTRHRYALGKISDPGLVLNVLVTPHLRLFGGVVIEGCTLLLGRLSFMVFIMSSSCCHPAFISFYARAQEPGTVDGWRQPGVRQWGVVGHVVDQGSHVPSKEAATAQLQAIFIKKKCRSSIPEYPIFQEKLENLSFMWCDISYFLNVWLVIKIILKHTVWAK